MHEVRIGCAFLPITITTISYNARQLRKAHFASFSHKEQRMCLDTFSRLRRSLATSTLYAAVRILAERFLLYRKQFPVKKIRRIITFYLLSFSGLFISLPKFTFSLFSLRMEYEVPFSQRLPLPAPSKVRFHWSFHRLFPGRYIRPYPPAAFVSADSNPRSYR